MLFTTGALLIGFSCWNFFQGFYFDDNLYLSYCIDEVMKLKNDPNINFHDYLYLFDKKENLNVFIVENLSILKCEGRDILDYGEIYDAYENLGLKVYPENYFYDRWLIDYKKSTLSLTSWNELEQAILEEIKEAQINIDNEEAWFDNN